MEAAAKTAGLFTASASVPTVLTRKATPMFVGAISQVVSHANAMLSERLKK